MQIFRRLLGSKYGGVFAGGFLAIIAFAFIAGDLSNSNFSLGGQSSSEVARIGKLSLTTAELQSRTQMVFERVRRDNPALTIDQFLADNGLNRVADELIASKALIAYGEKHGMKISKALVDAQIATNPAFVDATGNFSETVFRQLLSQQRVSEMDLRDDIKAQIIQQQLLTPVSAGAKAPTSMVPPYAAMLIEERTGEMFGVPSATFAPKAPPTDAELRAYFAANGSQFAIPEQRKLRYALVNLSRFEAQAKPTEAELAALYKSKAAQYQARQVRDFSQLILTTQAAANDAAAKAKQGQALTAVASSLGLAATRIDNVDQSQLASQTNADIAKAGFAAASNGVIGPVRSPLGWAVLRVEAVRDVPGKTLDQVRAELTPELVTVKERQLFSEFLSEIDGKLGDGVGLADIAKEKQLTLVETPFIIRDGKAPRDPAFKADPALTAVLEAAFAASQDDDAQIVAVKPDEEAAILSVSDIVPEGPPAFNDVKAAVQVAWALDKGTAQARKVATQLAAELGKGGDPAAALAKLGLNGTPRQPLAARRADINQQNGRIPAPLEALFTIKQGATRMIPLDNKQGFIVVRLNAIKPNDPNKVPQLMQSTAAGLSNVLGSEYSRQMLGAIQKELGVTRNKDAMASVEAELRRTHGGGAE